MDALLTQAEVAERLRRPVATLSTGPKSANVGGRVLYRESDVEQWISAKFELADVSGGPDAA
jgi:hypothetical protein